MFVASAFNKVDEVNIEFPIPRKAEIEVHVSIVQAWLKFVEGRKKLN